MLKIGIIGAGHMGGLHARMLSRDERARVTAIYDLAPERAAACAREHDAATAASIEALIDAVDAVVVTTPNTEHVEATLQALGAGRHVLCEKPLATSPGEARRVWEAGRGAGVVLQVGHNRRFAPVYQKVKELITLGVVTPHSVHSKMNRGELLNPPWVGDAAVTGGYLYETPIHMLDMLRWLCGEVESVTVRATAHEYSEPDDFSMLFSFRGGAHATLATAADASWHFPFERLEVFGHHATIETLEMERMTYTVGLEGGAVTEDHAHLEREVRWGYAQEDRAFVDAILSGEPAPVTALDGLRAVELTDACYRSARAGERVWLS